LRKCLILTPRLKFAKQTPITPLKGGISTPTLRKGLIGVAIGIVIISAVFFPLLTPRQSFALQNLDSENPRAVPEDTGFPVPEDTGFLWLINRENPLPPDFKPDDLTEFEGVRLREPARDAFTEMLAAMKAEGIDGLHLQSAYRTYSYQRAIFNEKFKSLLAKGNNPGAAAAIAAQAVQLPGASEHQLGLALDVSINGSLSQSFAETNAGRWLEENCHKFGFIIRYPRAKTDITNIIYEPWHLRYVGFPHAQIMKEASLTLEEYHEFLMGIPMYVCWCDDDYYLVKYSATPLEITENTSVSKTGLDENSGNIIAVKKPKMIVHDFGL